MSKASNSAVSRQQVSWSICAARPAGGWPPSVDRPRCFFSASPSSRGIWFQAGTQARRHAGTQARGASSSSSSAPSEFSALGFPVPSDTERFADSARAILLRENSDFRGLLAGWICLQLWDRKHDPRKNYPAAAASCIPRESAGSVSRSHLLSSRPPTSRPSSWTLRILVHPAVHPSANFSHVSSLLLAAGLGFCL
eukprot:CAMPEP_0171518996 /NCGR_PEP_ID=MMETSP0959-20130129/5612_1 /TAXON_ID=87120 /ORGANISM="Aurantiochytrium limacinum, Strain ATCCMYA-1381" /LENGTH=195 /DNA_ID=CAMNT_0012058299 /DNA_START=387 /DNA_END=971 /DNA_ORIENTATION=-